MGYYATAEGSVTLKQYEYREKVLNKLRGVYEIYDVALDNIVFGEYDKYFETDVKAALNSVLPYISEGEVEYTGDDNAHWRFILKNGEWVEQNGHIVYDDE